MNIVLMAHGTFTYQYDWYSQLEEMGTVPRSPAIEDRLVAALGMSAPWPHRRESSRIARLDRPWVQRNGPELEERLRRHLKPTNQSWRVDETYLRRPH